MLAKAKRSQASRHAVNIQRARLTGSGGVWLIKPLQDVGDHERCGSGGAVLSGDVSLLSEACGHVVHNGDNNAYWVLGHWDALG